MNNKIFSAQTPQSINNKYFYQAFDLCSLSKNNQDSVLAFKAVVQTNNPLQGVEDVSLTRNLLTQLENAYYQSSTENKFESLKTVVNKIAKDYSKLLNVAFIIITSKFCYLSAVGKISILLQRNNKLHFLIDSKQTSPPVISGRVFANDIFLIASSALFEKMRKNDVNNKLTIEDLNILPNYIVTNAENEQSWRDVFAIVTGVYRNPEQQTADTQPLEQISKNQKPTTGVNKIPKNTIALLKPLSSLFTSITNLKRQKNLYVKGIEDDGVKQKHKKTATTTGIILLILLGVSIIFGVNKNNQDKTYSKYSEAINEAKHNLTEAEKLFSINPDRARALFIQARDKINGFAQEGKKINEVSLLQKNIDSLRSKYLGEYFPETSVFVDLSLLTNGFSADQISSSEKEFYILDKENKKIAKVEFQSKRSEIVAGQSKIGENPIAIASYSNKLYVIDSDGVFEISSAIKQRVIDKPFSENILISSFASNIYILDKSESKIYRYSGDGKTFSNQNNWLSEENNISLVNAKQMLIDGYVWITLKDNLLLKFSKGNAQKFNLDKNLTGDFVIDYFFTSQESESVYFLNASAGKIFVFSKDGKYIAQYFSEEIKNTAGIVVSETNKQIILAKKDKLILIKIEHL